MYDMNKQKIYTQNHEQIQKKINNKNKKYRNRYKMNVVSHV